MGKQIELTPENEEALKQYKANQYMRSAPLIDDAEVVNRLLKSLFVNLSYGWCFAEE